MTTNQERALALLNDLAERGDDDAVSTLDAVHELAAAGLLAPEPSIDVPRPEDVSDPQPGEAWLVNYKGTHYEAVYWYSPLYAHWAFVENRDRGLKTVESPEATPVSRLAAAGHAEQEPING